MNIADSKASDEDICQAVADILNDKRLLKRSTAELCAAAVATYRWLTKTL